MTNGISRQVAIGLTIGRDAMARGLRNLGVLPNHLTVAGLVLTLAGAGCLGVGLARGGSDVSPLLAEGRGGQPGNWWLLASAGLILLAGAMDILDGAVARVGGRKGSDSGAFLDSTLDRFSDMALYVAMGVGFAWRENFTYTLLAMLALCNAVLISYVRARAEVLIARCKVGYYERGERMVGILIAVTFYQVPALLWLLATMPMLTAIRRIRYTLDALAHRRRTGVDPSAQACPGSPGTGGPAADGPPSPRLRRAGVYRFALWRYPRGSLAYDLVTAVNVGFLLLAPISGAADPLRAWLG